VSVAKGQMYLYHKVGDKMVLDRADHTDHHRQALAEAGLPAPAYVAGTFLPLTEDQAKAYALSAGVTWDPTPRKPLPGFQEPSTWAGIRAKNAAAKAAKEARK